MTILFSGVLPKISQIIPTILSRAPQASSANMVQKDEIRFHHTFLQGFYWKKKPKEYIKESIFKNLQRNS